MTATTVDKHPAPYSPQIIAQLATLIPLFVPHGHGIHDPFGGEGVRLGALCDRLGYLFSGTDLEPWRDGDPRIVVGNARHADSYPACKHAVVTSPTYNNGVNDHFAPRDDSRRLTYRVRAGRPLHVDNTGRYSGRGSKRGEATYWQITRDAVAHWPTIALVNVKDSPRSSWEGGVYPLVQLWNDLLVEHGYTVWKVDVVCPGWRVGTNHEKRAEAEAILCCVRHVAPPPVLTREDERAQQRHTATRISSRRNAMPLQRNSPRATRTRHRIPLQPRA